MEFTREEIVENHSNWLNTRDDLYELDENNEKIYKLACDSQMAVRRMRNAVANRLGVSTQHIDI